MLENPQTEQLTKASGPSLRIRMLLLFSAIAVSIVLIVILTLALIYNSIDHPRHEGTGVATGVNVKTFVSLPGDKAYPISLAAAPDGSMYLSQFGVGEIDKLDSSGNSSVFLGHSNRLTAPTSLVVGPQGDLYVIDFSSNTVDSSGTLKRITADGTINSFGGSQGSGLSLSSSLAFDNQNLLYMTADTRIWRFAPDGSAIAWWDAPGVSDSKAQLTGILYDPAHQAMLVADVGTGTIYRLAITDKATAGDALVLYRQTDFAAYGLALDDQGRLLMTTWAHDDGQLNRLESNGTLTLLANGFRSPIGIVYRTQKVYIANSDLTGIISSTMFGVLPSPLRAKPPFTIDVVTLGS